MMPSFDKILCVPSKDLQSLSDKMKSFRSELFDKLDKCEDGLNEKANANLLDLKNEVDGHFKGSSQRFIARRPWEAAAE